MKSASRYKVGFMRTEGGRVIPMYNTDKEWRVAKARRIKKVEEIEKSLKESAIQ